jgi:uncharacterized pyridoxamine 5'-phosphate oxidase family protein
MNDVKMLLKNSQYGYLATVDSGKPRVRAFGFMFEEDGRFYFCTNSTKDVYRQLNEIPYAEYAVTASDMTILRMSGKVIFTEEPDKKEKALNSSELVKMLYKTSSNPIFKVFYIEHGTAVISDFSGKPPRKIEF